MSINKFYFYISRTVFLFWTLIQIYNITLEKHNRFSCTVKFAIMFTYEQGMKKSIELLCSSSSKQGFIFYSAVLSPEKKSIYKLNHVRQSLTTNCVP